MCDKALNTKTTKDNSYSAVIWSLVIGPSVMFFRNKPLDWSRAKLADFYLITFILAFFVNFSVNL